MMTEFKHTCFSAYSDTETECDCYEDWRKMKNNGIIVENVVKIFSFDCFICAMNGVRLEGYMIDKHKWNEKQFKEYLNVYRSSLCSK